MANTYTIYNILLYIAIVLISRLKGHYPEALINDIINKCVSLNYLPHKAHIANMNIVINIIIIVKLSCNFI